MKILHKNQKSFTYIELVFVIVILAILASVISLNFRPNNKESLDKAAESTLSNIRLAQSLALSSDAFTARGDNTVNSIVPLIAGTDLRYYKHEASKWWHKRWRIKIHSNGSYSVFADATRKTNPADTNPNTNNLDKDPEMSTEIAKDPITRLCLTGLRGTALDAECQNAYSDETMLSKRDMNITLESPAGVFTKTTLLFDEIGRPYDGLEPTNAPATICTAGATPAGCRPYRNLILAPARILIGFGVQNGVAYNHQSHRAICITPHTGFAYISSDSVNGTCL